MTNGNDKQHWRVTMKTGNGQCQWKCEKRGLTEKTRNKNVMQSNTHIGCGKDHKSLSQCSKGKMAENANDDGFALNQLRI